MKYSFLIFVFLFAASCADKPKNCVQYKTGMFKYGAPEFENIHVLRNDSLQIETDSVLGLKFVSSIEWLSDCMYSATLLEANREHYDSVIGKTLHVDIISTTGKSYEYKAYEGSVLKNVGVMIKIEE